MRRALIFVLLFASAAAFHPSSYASDDQESVYQISPWVDGSIIFATSLGSLIPFVNEDRLLHPHCPCDPGSVNALDRHVIGNESHAADVISDVTVGLAMIGPPVADAFSLGWSPALLEDVTVYAEVLSVSGAFVTLAKYTVQRPIPRVYAGQVSATDPTNYRSFYSGHATMTFSALSAAAVTTNLRYHWGIWPWVATCLVGLSVGEERILAGQHFYTDVAVGTVMGALVGVGIPLLHKLDDSEQSVSIERADDGLGLAWSRRF